MGIRFKDPLIGIIGGTGAMGLWLASLFEKNGLNVIKVGRSTEFTPEYVAKNCNVVVISVPISVTENMIKKIGPLMSQDSLLMDLTSIKKMPLETMLKYSQSEVVGLHPLFGPEIELDLEKKVVVCPGRGEKGKEWIVEFLNKNGYETIFLDPETHDRLMGIVQGVNHFETLCLSLMIKKAKMDLKTLRKVSTQSFLKKLIRIEEFLNQDPELFSSIIMENKSSIEHIDSYLQCANQLLTIVKNKDKETFKNLFLDLRKLVKKEN